MNQTSKKAVNYRGQDFKYKGKRYIVKKRSLRVGYWILEWVSAKPGDTSDHLIELSEQEIDVLLGEKAADRIMQPFGKSFHQSISF